METNGIRIGEVTERTGLSVPTLRYYDSVGLVSPSGRTPGGFRLYSEEDVRDILLIRRMKPLSFTLEHMRDFLEAATLVKADHDGTAKPNAATLEQAHAILREIEEEAKVRHEKLQKQLTYAEEFIDLLGELQPPHKS